MKTLDIPEYAVTTEKGTTYGDARHAKSRITNRIKWRNDHFYGLLEIYKRSGEKYILFFNLDDLNQLQGDYEQIKRQAYGIIDNA